MIELNVPAPEDTVIEVIKQLSWDYKSNQPFKIGRRLVVGYASTYWSLDYDTMRMLDALERETSAPTLLCLGDDGPRHRGGHRTVRRVPRVAANRRGAVH